MTLKSQLKFYGKELLGDGYFSLLFKRNLARKGLASYSHVFESLHNEPANWLVDCPDYGNLGDQAIAMAERRILARSSRPFRSFSGNTSQLLLCLKRYAKQEDIIFLQGGGNMTALYPEYEENRLRVISMMRQNRIVLFPQTISYGSSQEDRRLLERTKRIYGSHPDLHLIAREYKSYDRMRALYPNLDVQMTPDIVLSMRGMDRYPFPHRRGILLCMRNDKEKSVGDIQGELERLATSSGERWSYTDTMAFSEPTPITQERGEALVNSKWDEFGSAKLVVTDRLHGMIFCAITGTPCIAMDNSNGKVGYTYNQWLGDLPYIHFAHNVDEVRALVPSALALTETHFPEECFEDLFAPLKKLIP